MDLRSTSSVVADAIPSNVRLGESLCCPFLLTPDAAADFGNLKSHLEARTWRPVRSSPAISRGIHLLRCGFMIGCHPVLDDQAFETLEAAFYSLSTL